MMKWIIFFTVLSFTPAFDALTVSPVAQAQNFDSMGETEVKKSKKKRKKRKKRRRGKKRRKKRTSAPEAATSAAAASENGLGMYGDLGLLNTKEKESEVGLSGLGLRSGVLYQIDMGAFKLPLGAGIFFDSITGKSTPIDVTMSAFGLNVLIRPTYALSDSFLLGLDIEYNMVMSGSYIGTTDLAETTGELSGSSMGYGPVVQFMASQGFGFIGGLKMVSGTYKVAIKEIKTTSGTTPGSGNADAKPSGMLIFGGLVLFF